MERAQEEYNTYDEAVNNSTTNSERSKAIKDRNEYITSLLEQNAAYAKYIHTTFENGEIVLTLDSDALAEAVNEVANAAVRAGAYNAVAQAQVSALRYQYYAGKAYNNDLIGRFTYITGYSKDLKTRQTRHIINIFHIYKMQKNSNRWFRVICSRLQQHICQKKLLINRQN